MDIDLPEGKYVLAVSGGVDSMVLLDVLAGKPGVQLVVAHLDHGIRGDSAEDAKLVKDAAQRYGLSYAMKSANLGKGVSEAVAREVRYQFLRQVMAEYGAQAIITAHHQDDALETAVLNLIRGTGRKGLAALTGQKDVLRPFLHVTKEQIRSYADEHRIQWREDSTNAEDVYLRNYIRHNIMPRFSGPQRKQLLSYINTALITNREIDELLLSGLANKDTPAALNRKWFVMLPFAVACETIAAWLRQNGIREFDRQLVERLVVKGMTAAPGKVIDVKSGYVLKVSKDQLELHLDSSRKN